MLPVIIAAIYGGLLYEMRSLEQFWLVAVMAVFLGWACYIWGMSRRF